MKVIYTLACLLLLGLPLRAQTPAWQGGLFAGVANYSGDINPSLTPNFDDTGLSTGLVGSISVSRKFNFRGSLTYAHLTGDDANYQQRENRGFRFTTNLVELSAIAEWEPFGSTRYYADARGNVQMDRLVSPYLFAGFGLAFASLDTDFSRYQGDSEVIRAGIAADRQQGSSKSAITVPMGAGVKFDLTQRFSLALEIGGRFTMSDYLDGISESAGPDQDDLYILSGLIAYYRFYD